MKEKKRSAASWILEWAGQKKKCLCMERRVCGRKRYF